MVEEHQDRKKGKTHTRMNSARHGFGSTTRLGKHKATQSMARGHSSSDLMAELGNDQQGMPPRLNRTNSRFNTRVKAKKPVIQLERSDSDENEDFTDVESGDESQPSSAAAPIKEARNDIRIPLPQLSSSQPKVSDETVLSLSGNPGDAIHTKKLSGTFVDESDFVSSAVIHADDDLKSIFGEQSMRTVGNLSRGKGRKEPTSGPHRERDRLMERILKQFLNITNIQNPIIDSIKRSGAITLEKLSLAQHPPIASPLAHKPHHNLSATTMAQLDDPHSRDATYLLSKMWQEGWVDPDRTPQPTPSQTPKRGSPTENNIGAKARWAAQRLSSGNLKREEGIKLA